MRTIDADKLSEHKFTRESAKGSDYMRGWNDAIDTIVDNEPTVERPIKGLARLDDNGEVKIELLSLSGKCKTCKYYHPYYERSEPRGDGYCVIARMTPEGMTTINCSDEFGCSDYQKCERRASDV